MTEAGFTGFERGILGSTAENLSSLDYQIQKDIYTTYRKAGYSKKYYDAHESDILIHKAAKKAFDDLALKKTAHRQEPASGIFRSARTEEARLCRACQGA